MHVLQIATVLLPCCFVCSSNEVIDNKIDITGQYMWKHDNKQQEERKKKSFVFRNPEMKVIQWVEWKTTFLRSAFFLVLLDENEEDEEDEEEDQDEEDEDIGEGQPQQQQRYEPLPHRDHNHHHHHHHHRSGADEAGHSTGHHRSKEREQDHNERNKQRSHHHRPARDHHHHCYDRDRDRDREGEVAPKKRGDAGEWARDSYIYQWQTKSLLKLIWTRLLKTIQFFPSCCYTLKPQHPIYVHFVNAVASFSMAGFWLHRYKYKYINICMCVSMHRRRLCVDMHDYS